MVNRYKTNHPAALPALAISLLCLWFAMGSACVLTPEHCKTGADCPPPFQVCVNQQCVVCRVDNDCAAPQICRDSACQSPSQVSEPQTESQTEPQTESQTEPPTETREDALSEPQPTERPPQEPLDEARADQALDAASTPEAIAEPTPEPIIEDPAPICKVGTQRTCYPGPPAARGKGTCHDGIQACDTTGNWQACKGATLPEPEVCDDKDNNCDGQIDESFPLKGKPCFQGRGACQKAGVYICGPGPFQLRCNAVSGAPANERCNDKIDNNCDGRVDEGCTCPLNTTIACGSQVGACQLGTQRCTRDINGITRWSGCSSPTSTGNERCDGIDNNCDGLIDEGCCLPTKQHFNWAAHTADSTPQPTKITGLVFDRNQQVLTSGDQHIAKIWKLTPSGTNPTAVSSKSVITTSTSIVAMAVDAQRSRFYAFALKDTSIEIWEEDQKIRSTLKGHTGAINALSFDEEGKTLASASEDKTVLIWLADKGSVSKTLTGHTAAVKAVAFAPNNRDILATGAMDQTIRVWDTDDGQVKILQGHTAGVVGLAWRGDGQELYSISLDRTLRRWDMSKTAPPTTILTAPPGELPIGIALSPDQNWLVAIYDSGKIRFWDTAQFQLRASITQPSPSGAVAWSQDSRYIALGDNKGVVHLWKCP